MAFSSVLQMYLGWANSLLCEQGVLIDGLHQLRDGTIFCHLIELLTGTQLLPADQDAISETQDSLALDNVQIALDYLTGVGVKLTVTAEGVVQGELKSILDVMWSIILHCTIHSPERAAYQRTVRIGRKLLLQWCGQELGANIDTNKSMVSVFSSNNHLSDLLSLHCSFENNKEGRDKYLVNLTNGILAAEDHFGISKTLLGPADVINGTADEHSLMIYIALLRRKMSMLTSRRCSLSSDEDESIKISPKKQITRALTKTHTFRFMRKKSLPRKHRVGSVMKHKRIDRVASCPFCVDPSTRLSQGVVLESPNTSILSAANSVYSERSSFSSNLSHLSTPQPPHHRYTRDYSSVISKPFPEDASPSRPTNQDVTPEKSDSGISTSADAPSSSSSSLPSITSARMKDLRERRMDWREPQHILYGATPPRTKQSQQDSDILKDATNIVHIPSSRRNELNLNERQTDARPRMRRFQVNRSELRNSSIMQPSSGFLYHNVSRPTENTKQGVVSLSSEQVNEQEIEGCKKDDDASRVEDGQGQDSKDSVTEVSEDGPARTPDDELLHLLDTISEESQHLRLELSETQQREAMLKTQLEKETVGCTKEEKVISKLVQELEMLRTENRRLFRESANARNTNALDRKTVEKLNATIGKLQSEVEHQNAENFNLKMKLKVGSDLGSVEARRGSDVLSLASGTRDGTEEMGLSEHSSESRETSELSDLKRELARAESQKEFLQARLKETEEELTRKLNQTTDDLRASKLENLRLEKECKLLRMSSETSRLEVETVAGRCRRLEEYLSHAQKRNTRLAQQLEEETYQALSHGTHDQKVASMAKLQEENALLKEKVELAEEERELLKQELAHYRLNKTTLDEVLRAWDVQTSSKFQSFLDEFRLHISEQREHQEMKRIRNLEMETQRVKEGEKQVALPDAEDHKEILHSARSSSSVVSEGSEQVSERQEAGALSLIRGPVFTHQRGTRQLTAENVAAVERSQAVVDEKYLQISPRRVDTDTEIDSEMESQTTDDAFCDLPNGYSEEGGRQMVAAGGMARIKSSEGFRRPSLGDLIVAKAQNSPPDDDGANKRGLDRYNSKVVNMGPKNENNAKDIDEHVTQKKEESSDVPAASGETSRNLPPGSHLAGKTRFSAVNSSMESLRGITKKAKLNPGSASALDSDKVTTVPCEFGPKDSQTKVPAGRQNEEDAIPKTGGGGDSLKSLESIDTRIPNGYGLDYPSQPMSRVSYDSKSLPERESPSLRIHQRVGPVRGRFSRWRRMQNRFQPALDGSYLDENRASSDSVQNVSSQQKQDWRNRSSSLGSPLNSDHISQTNSSRNSNQLEETSNSEMGTNSFESEEEFARLPDPRSITKDLALVNTRKGEDLTSQKRTQRERADGKDESKTSMSRQREEGGASSRQKQPEDLPDAQMRMVPMGSLGNPQFSSPQRLGYLRSKLGIKLERELLTSSSILKSSHLNEGQVASSSSAGVSDLKLLSETHSSDPLPTKQIQSSKLASIQSLEKQPSSDVNVKVETTQNAVGNNRETENEKLTSGSNSSSPEISKMSPASRNQYYRHKMMAEQDQEYANSIIDKYLNQIQDVSH